MKKGLLSFLSGIVAPVPYPAAAGYHAIVGSTIIWGLHGAPRAYSRGQLLSGLAISLVVGALGVLLITLADKKQQ